MGDIAYTGAAPANWQWRWPVFALLATVFFVPMQRYELPVNLPIHLEPYRPLVALVFALWFLSLLMMDARLRRTSLDAPILLLLIAVGLSLAANPGRFGAYQAEALKFVSMFLTFVVTYYLFTSVVRRAEEIELIVRAIVAFGAVVALFAIIESRTGFTPFTHLQTLVPILRELPTELVFSRQGRLRAFGTAEHPIALGALLVMVVPFAVYLCVSTRRLLWVACSVLLVVGALSTVSRTAVLMLAVILIAFAALRWNDIRRYWILILPILAVVHFLAPGTLGVIKGSFLPAGGLVAEQSENAASQSSSGRLADFGPAFEEFETKPLFGSGLGTRITVGPSTNARLLDNQWLGLLIDSGLAGTLAFGWLVLRFTRQQFRAARVRRGVPGYLPLACGASSHRVRGGNGHVRQLLVRTGHVRVLRGARDRVVAHAVVRGASSARYIPTNFVGGRPAEGCARRPRLAPLHSVTSSRSHALSIRVRARSYAPVVVHGPGATAFA